MILSHRYRYIFIKTRKTAGTSVELALSRFCGPDDVITPVSPADERLRQRIGGRAPQHYQNRPTAGTKALSEFARFYNHMSAVEIREAIGDITWAKYFKFTIVRNPWDAVVSRYFFAYRNEPRLNFGDALRGDSRLIQSCHDLYTIDATIVVDQCLRFERLRDDLNEVRLRLGLPQSLLPLPAAKTGFRTDPRHYRDFYTAEDREIVRRHFAREIEAFGYEW